MGDTDVQESLSEMVNPDGNGFDRIDFSDNTSQDTAAISDGGPDTDWVGPAGGVIYNISENVGIGTTTPQTELHIIGTVTATAFEGDGSLLTGLTDGDWVEGSGTVYNTGDNIGIGTTTPSTELEIIGTVTATSYLGNIENASMARLPGSTFSTAQHMQDIFHSSGLTTGGLLATNGTGTINVGSGTGFIRDADDEKATVYFFDWTETNGLVIGTNTTQYVGVEYNAGSPIITTRTTDNFNNHDEFILGVAVSEEGLIHVASIAHQVGDHASHMIERSHQVNGIARDNVTGGLLLSDPGTRTVALSAGALWDRLKKVSIPAINTSISDTFDIYYRGTSTNFIKVEDQAQWGNLQYDDGSGTLVTLSNNNKFAVVWFYLELDGRLTAQYGRQEHDSSASAEAEDAPSTAPDRISNLSTLVGSIVFQKNASTASSILSAFTTSFSGALAADHGNLTGLLDDDHTQYVLDAGDNMTGTLTITGGFVGVGTTTPSTELEIVGTVTATAFAGDGSALTGVPGVGEFVDGGEAGGGDRTLGNTDNFALGFLTNGTTSIHIEADGDVGIGTVSPGTHNLYIKDPTEVNVAFDAPATGIKNWSFKENGSQKAFISHKGTSIGNRLDMAADGGATSHLSILNSGNVGIGTITPAVALHVIGAAKISGGVEPPYVSFTENETIQTAKSRTEGYPMNERFVVHFEHDLMLEDADGIPSFGFLDRKTGKYYEIPVVERVCSVCQGKPVLGRDTRGLLLEDINGDYISKDDPDYLEKESAYYERLYATPIPTPIK
jgi:hypothetical protein